MHHATFLVFLERTLQDWDSNTCIGDIIYNAVSTTLWFSKREIWRNQVPMKLPWILLLVLVSWCSTLGEQTRAVLRCST